MDYIGTNIRLDSGAIQGDYSMTGVGRLRHVGDRIWLYVRRSQADSGACRGT
jgi:hypothetical protein